DLDAEDYDGDELVYTIEGGEGSSISTTINGNSIEFTPLSNFNGSESFIITVSDGELSDVQIVIISIIAINDEPVAQAINLDVNEDEQTAIVLDGLDIDGDPISYSIINNPIGTIISIEGSIVNYVPQLNFIGTDSFSYKVSDGILDSEEAIVTLTVNDVNDPPTVNIIENQFIDEDSVNISTPLSLAIIATDIDGDDLIYDYIPEDNVLMWIDGNLLNIVPNQNYYGELDISVIISDGELNTIINFILFVESVNDAPEADNMSIVLYEDTSTSFNFNATDVDNFNLSYDIPIDQEPEHGDYNITSGFITYTPDDNYFGSDELFFTVSDGELSASGTIFIDILNVDDPFYILSTPSLEATEDQEYTYQIILDDPDEDEFEYTLENEPAGMYVSQESGLITWTPVEGINSSGFVTLFIEDNIDPELVGNIEQQSFEINVLAVNDPPVIISIPIENIYVDSNYTYQLDIQDPDNELFSFELFDYPDGMEIDNNGLISWTPSSTGLYENIIVSVFDGEFTADQIFDIDVKVLQEFNFLNAGNNLISFMGLKEDNSIETIFSSLDNNLSHIFSESYASIYLEDYGWFGSLDSLRSTSAYWLRLLEEDDFQLDSYRFIDSSEEIVYNLHYGNNLISYIGTEIFSDLDDIFPDDVEDLFIDIIGENSSATRIDGEWVGSLANNGLQPLRGYWVNVSEELDFSYNFSENLARNNNEIIDVDRMNNPEDFFYNQSQNQAFYFFKDININGIEISKDDWIIAFHNEIIVGARKWSGEYTDIAVMGYDGFSETLGYCQNNSKVDFKIFRSSELDFINLSNDIPNWENLNNFVIENSSNIISEFPSDYSVGLPYPNPFNPILNIELEIPNYENININIYNIRGQLVEILVDNKSFSPGYHTIDWDASHFSSGIYLIKIKSDEKNIVRKVTLLK
ncbi:tandem-95 repeat protein, partial [Candidatus Marinimicrobia bacterium]|nr:tandem-95 repeat protein [Candidatus Neomarinimicrobiota bacterium]